MPSSSSCLLSSSEQNPRNKEYQQLSSHSFHSLSSYSSFQMDNSDPMSNDDVTFFSSSSSSLSCELDQSLGSKAHQVSSTSTEGHNITGHSPMGKGKQAAVLNSHQCPGCILTLPHKQGTTGVTNSHQDLGRLRTLPHRQGTTGVTNSHRDQGHHRPLPHLQETAVTFLHISRGAFWR